MRVIKTRTKTEEYTDDHICNKCGNSLYDGFNYEGLTDAYFQCGYGSIIGDGTTVHFDLCEKCLLEIFETFKHSPYEGEEEEA